MSVVKGTLRLPGDKSLSHRAAIFSAFRPGRSEFTNFNLNRDCAATVQCLSDLGVKISVEGNRLQVEGKHLHEWQRPAQELNAENSGTTARLLSGLLCNLKFSTTLIGDDSLSKRPMKRIIDPLSQMGASIESNNGYLPLTFNPVDQLKGITYELPVPSAQVKSAVLLAGLFASGRTTVIEKVASRDHTERLLGLPVEYDASGRKIIHSSADLEIPDISMTIPGDFSSAAFFITAALLLPGSQLIIENVSLNPTRTGFLTVLQKMGAQIEVKTTQQFPEPMGTITVTHQQLSNIQVPAELVPNIIDEIPILSILSARSRGVMELRNARELRFKESDRIKAIVENLRKVGIQVEEYEDGFRIEGPQNFTGGTVTTFDDHRIAMSFAIAGLISQSPIKLDNPQCVAVSFPQFFDLLKQVVQR